MKATIAPAVSVSMIQPSVPIVILDCVRHARRTVTTGPHGSSLTPWRANGPPGRPINGRRFPVDISGHPAHAEHAGPGRRSDRDRRQPDSRGPGATLATAYADKLTAFATRPNLKWRDVFDLWWIGTPAWIQHRGDRRAVPAQRHRLRDARRSAAGGRPAPLPSTRSRQGGRQADYPALRRWLIQGHGRARAVYFNLLANPHAAQDHLVDAPLLAFVSAVLIGARQSHHGWRIPASR